MKKSSISNLFDISRIPLSLLLCCTALASSITKPHAFSSGATIYASHFNENFDTLYSDLNSKETRLAAIESRVNTLNQLGNYVLLTMPVGTTIAASYVVSTSVPLETIKNTVSSSAMTVGANSVTINQAGYYRVIVASSDLNCNYDSAFLIRINVNGVAVGGNAMGQCTGAKYEYLDNLSAGDAITFDVAQGNGSARAIDSAGQKRIRFSIFAL